MSIDELQKLTKRLADMSSKIDFESYYIVLEYYNNGWSYEDGRESLKIVGVFILLEDAIHYCDSQSLFNKRETWEHPTKQLGHPVVAVYEHTSGSTNIQDESWKEMQIIEFSTH